MRKTVLMATVAVTMLPLAVFAQAPGTAATSAPPASGAASRPAAGNFAPPRDVVPQAGSPLYPDSETGRDLVASDGISTKTVKAAPCGTAAHETDGFTTCVGITNAPVRKQR
jgi:hypothetical protein